MEDIIRGIIDRVGDLVGGLLGSPQPRPIPVPVRVHRASAPPVDGDGLARDDEGDFGESSPPQM